MTEFGAKGEGPGEGGIEIESVGEGCFVAGLADGLAGCGGTGERGQLDVSGLGGDDVGGISGEGLEFEVGDEAVADGGVVAGFGGGLAVVV